MASIKIYGTDWCEDTQRSRAHLIRLAVPFVYIDIEQDFAAREWVHQHNAGKQRTPTIDLEGDILVEPTDEELDQALRHHALIFT